MIRKSETPSTWPAPNYVNPQSRQPMLLATEITLITITVFVVVLRTYSRGVISQSIGADDWIMILATVIAVALTVSNCASAGFGWGLHIWDFQPQWYVTARKLALSCQILFVFASTFTKLSILAFYMRIIINTRFRIFVYIGFALVSGLGISFAIAVVTQCRPLPAYWNPALLNSNCIEELPAFLAQGALNTFTDFYVFVLPLRTVWRIQLPTRQRIGLVAIFALGFVVCIAGCLRIWSIKVVLHDSRDNTWEGAVLYILTAIECNVGIVCASIPAIKPFFARFFPRLLGSAYKPTSNSRSFPLKTFSGVGENSRKCNATVTAQVTSHQNESEEYIITASAEGINKHVDISIQYTSSPGDREKSSEKSL